MWRAAQKRLAAAHHHERVVAQGELALFFLIGARFGTASVLSLEPLQRVQAPCAARDLL